MRLVLTVLILACVFFFDFLRADPRLEFDQSALDDYVHQPDEAYRCTQVRSRRADRYTTHLVELISQNYLTEQDVDRTEWRHLLQVIEPSVIKHEAGLLMIGGGDNVDQLPDQENELLVRYALATGSVVAELSMVPNQPLVFEKEGKPRWEDALIAYTWERYLTSGDSRWPARMAMTKSAVSAMDCLESMFAGKSGRPLSDFVVAGASKRGWTTWTTGAVDDRVKAIIPIVIDVLNVERSFEHHWQTYGFWAPAIQDYVEMGTVDWWGTPELRALFKLVDPLSYKERYVMPKFLVNAAGDQFFVPTSSQFYFDQLPGEKYLRYVPNAGHGLRDSDALESVLAFYAAVLNNHPRPEFAWEFKPDGGIEVETQVPPIEVSVWVASNPSARDFRIDTIGKSWHAQAIHQNKQGRYEVKVEAPAQGWTAYFVELKYETPFDIPLTFTTPVRVLPDELPFEYRGPGNPREGFLTEK
ncbi:PhoPQ-activated pathogenicity-related family protein [Gammaproteobacteria bacterium]|nr:PhoPQ-activated pathogenicity-related family protein [Gammaproteobacteria bacterium]